MGMQKSHPQVYPESLSFSAYLAYPQEVADEVQITIRQTDRGLVFTTDWFPEEDFDLKVFASQEDGGIILMSKLLRETFFTCGSSMNR